MRGKAQNEQVCPNTIGITPAYAGKSSALIALSCLLRDHPRICGEKTKKIP